ncbi:hypothetical protein [Mesorhizobium caraganae]|uniref:hypothetical protein n=1 Tax=Mesorhizobium caraganae TaxID=483206 RepID=UPI003ECE2DE7
MARDGALNPHPDLVVQRELEARAAEMDTLRRQHIERTRHDAELARRRYMKVDPDNRLVADTLEADWNEKLRLDTDVVEDYERRAPEEAAALDAETQQRARDLVAQFRDDYRKRAALRRRTLDRPLPIFQIRNPSPT